MQRKITISAEEDAKSDYHRTRLKELKQSKNKHIQMYLVSLVTLLYLQVSDWHVRIVAQM